MWSLTLEVRFAAGQVEFDGLNLRQVAMLVMLVCVAVRPAETKPDRLLELQQNVGG